MQAFCLFRMILNNGQCNFACGILIRNTRTTLFHVKHEFHIANVGAPLSQKTTLEHSTHRIMVYRPPSHYVLPFPISVPRLCVYVSRETHLCSTWNKCYVVDCQCVSLWNACGTLLLGRTVSG